MQITSTKPHTISRDRAIAQEGSPCQCSSEDRFTPSTEQEPLLDSFGKRFVACGVLGAVTGFTLGVVNNDYPALAAIAGLGVGATIGLPGSLADALAVRAGYGLAGRATSVVAATAGGAAALALLAAGA